MDNNGVIEVWEVNNDWFKNLLDEHNPMTNDDWIKIVDEVSENGRLIESIKPDYTITVNI